ncbi:MAG TPA: AAA family ATPase [Bacteroidia bacterium]|nr:AAA family ATPase [Bacteroidia bacterium]
MKPSLIVLRGLPGSGKSTLARLLGDHGRWPVFSVDDYFTDPHNGRYEFKFAENHLAYQQCRENTEAAMAKKTEKIILDNAFTLDWELEPYFKLAADHQYLVFIVTVENYHGGKNKHGISDEQISKMAAKYRVRLL